MAEQREVKLAKYKYTKTMKFLVLRDGEIAPLDKTCYVIKKELGLWWWFLVHSSGSVLDKAFHGYPTSDECAYNLVRVRLYAADFDNIEVFSREGDK